MRKENLNMLVTVCVFIMAFAVPAGAVTHYVDPNGSADFTTIQAAITASSDGHTIIVMEGVYVENINMGGKAITLRSTNPLDSNTVLNTVINSNSSGSCITVDSGEDANTVIKGFLITGGRVGISCTNGSPTFTNCSISGNSGGNVIMSSGAGMFCQSSNPTLTNCTFSGNSAKDGGGMFCMGSNPTLTNCTFSGNSATGGDGAGMLCLGSNPTFTNCSIIGNSAGQYGGGMSNRYSNPTLTNCTFIANSAGQYGGGIYCDNSSPILTDSFLCGNFLSGTWTPSQIYGSYTDNGGNIINDACPPPVTKIEGDVDGDGVVDFKDLAILCGNWLAGKE